MDLHIIRFAHITDTFRASLQFNPDSEVTSQSGRDRASWSPEPLFCAIFRACLGAPLETSRLLCETSANLCVSAVMGFCSRFHPDIGFEIQFNTANYGRSYA